MLGVHWVADALGCDPVRLTPDGVRAALIELPLRLKLRPIGDPQLSAHEHDGVRTIAGVVLLAESHASCHCFPTDGAAHVDIFSCRPFELEAARRFILRHFGAAELRDSVLDRGGSESRHRGPIAELKRAR